jgi:SAM-dependent methyltransferase
MLSVISKEEYWSWRDAGVVSTGRGVLKDVQDAFALFHLKDLKGARVCEIGGGHSRVLPKLAGQNECWNVDRLEGEGGGPTNPPNQPKVRLVRAFMGEFSEELPSDYFDVVFSISVVEHIPSESYPQSIQDCARVLKPGGFLKHAIDVYLLDTDDNTRLRDHLRERVNLYLQTPEFSGGRLAWVRRPTIDENVAASAKHACNQVDELYNWNARFPMLRKLREAGASCSLQMILERQR